MNVTVIHNPTAGPDDLPPDELIAGLRAAGFVPTHADTRRTGWREAVREARDLVIAAGGDGTVSKVARELLGRVDRDVDKRPLPMAILPTGTANNIATSLGVRGHWRVLIRSVRDWRPRALDVGIAEGAWGRRAFVEGIGFGLFAGVVAESQPGTFELARAHGARVELRRDVARVRDALDRCEPRPCTVTIDGADATADALIVAALNIPSFGPLLRLATGARSDDGVLDVVIVHEAQRDEFAAYLEACMNGTRRVPRFDVRSGRDVRIEWPSGVAHVDDDVIPDAAGATRLWVRDRALTVLVPP